MVETVLLFHDNMTTPGLTEKEREPSRTFAAKYGYDPALADAALARTVEILRTLSTRLQEQRGRGSRYFIGNQLSSGYLLGGLLRDYQSDAR